MNNANNLSTLNVTPIAVYVLRQKTRPSEEECNSFFLECLSTNKERLFAFLQAGSKHPLSLMSANLNRETDDIDQQLDAFIKAEDGEHYLKEPERYIRDVFQFASGTPPEQTRLAIIYVKEVPQEIRTYIPDIDEFTKRGKRWEELERWGDALGCYYIALVLYPDNAELLLALGRIQMRYPQYISDAVKNLTRIVDLRPTDSSALLHLGRCYRLIVNTPEINVEGRPREELRHMALGFLERAAIIKPENYDIQAELESLRKELGLTSNGTGKSGFFQ